MGNKESTSLSASDIIEETQFFQKGYGQCSIVQFSTDQSKYVKKRKFITSEKQRTEFIRVLENYERCASWLAVELIGKRVENGMFCSSGDFVEGIFQYVGEDLGMEIEKRIEKKMGFKEKELLRMMRSILEGCKEMDSKGIQFQYFDLGNIMIAREEESTLYKLNIVNLLFDNQISPSPSYTPPETTQTTSQQSKVFMLGLISIQSLTLVPAQQLREVSYDNFKRIIHKSTCTKGLKDLLVDMVSVNPLNRPKYNEVLEEIERLEKVSSIMVSGGKLNRSMKKKSENTIADSRRKQQDSALSKLLLQQEQILTRRGRRQRNLLSQLYSPKPK